MFTGLIQYVGTVVEVLSMRQDVSQLEMTGLQLTVAFPQGDGGGPLISEPLVMGESIAINGVCTTVVATPQPYQFTVLLSPETLSVTTLQNFLPGQLCNLERAMRPTDRLGGHMVSGHVDTLAQLIDIVPDGESWRLYFRLKNSEWGRLLVAKGSIAVDGISLTLNGCQAGDETHPAQFDVAIIPHTWHHTNLQGLKPYDWVNIEFDGIGKYVDALLQAYLPKAKTLVDGEASLPVEDNSRIAEAFAPLRQGNSNIYTGKWFNLG